ncbi:uncharacterized protein [Panulirus ornatus]|uniref:uncharacterized protein n=1 Tax=Panulirus ornatus TaxID=150431 RepID=UPI003A85178A
MENQNDFFSSFEPERIFIRALERVESKCTGETNATVGQRSCSGNGGVDSVGAEGVGVEGRHPAVDGGEVTAVGGEPTVQVDVGGTSALTADADMKVLVLLALLGVACAVPVQDTQEVAAAKAEHQAAYNAAAARAEAAPDIDLDGRLSAYSGYLSAIDGRMSPLYTNTFGAYGINAPIPAAAPLTYSGIGLPGAFGLHPF